MSTIDAAFVAIREPGNTILDEMAALSPTNPFATRAYVVARRGFTGEPWVIGLDAQGHLSAGCLAHMRTGYLGRSLEIVSLPELPDPEVFWRGLREFCRRQHVEDLFVNTFASCSAAIPKLVGEKMRTDRCEYVLDLQECDLVARLSGDHRRNIARARKKGLTVRRATDRESCQAHAAMLLASMERRQHRGEAVPVAFGADQFVAIMEAGAGELFQAIEGGEVVSSMLLLRAARGAYSHTMGTNASGMKHGGSRLVIFEAARMLADEGFEVLNLGGISEDNPGLREFKLGFGARPVDLQSAGFSFATPFKRSIRGAARAVRSALVRTRGTKART